MGDFGVIGDVSETIVGALNAELTTLTPPARAELNDLSGAFPNGLVLTVTLYEIHEDAASRNRPRVQQTTTGAATVTRKPPMALLLRYLLTPWGSDQRTRQRMAGKAMQVLYDDAILDGLALRGTLAGGRDTVKITLAPLTLEDRTRVWWAIQKPYQLSLNYEIRVINLDALETSAMPAVRSRVLGQGLLESAP